MGKGMSESTALAIDKANEMIREDGSSAKSDRLIQSGGLPATQADGAVLFTAPNGFKHREDGPAVINSDGAKNGG